MSKFTDQRYLKSDQYKDSSNLDARVVIHKLFGTNPYGWMTWVFDHLLKLPEDAKILELGCGPGYLWKENEHRIPAGWRVTLSDLSSGMLDAAWRNLVVTGRAFQFKEIDAQSIPFEDGSFDAVIANHMLYHVSDRAKAISEMKRVLQPGGHLIATTVGEHHMEQMTAWYERVSHGAHAGMMTHSFTLENGAGQLKEFFADVTLSRYQDDLEITSIEPIIAYLRSAITLSEIDDAEVESLRVELEEVLKAKGKVFVRKDSGLFEAVK